MSEESTATIGLLPLYLELYDEVVPDLRKEFSPFIRKVVEKYAEKKINTVSSEICCTAPEFKSAISHFEEVDVDCIVTLHLSYSPSLECVESLSATDLPIVVLDTTPHSEFDSTDLLMLNHGIHGVQDMCNMLKRRGKKFFIEAGHTEISNVIERTVAHIIGSKIAKEFASSRVGKIGESFKGMGDFQVENSELAAMGIKVINATPADVSGYLLDSGDRAIVEEMEHNREKYDLSSVGVPVLERSVRSGLALRKWIEKESISALTINFQSITKNSGLPAMPFFEISMLMGRGIGYAGEGDVLTATLVGALTKVLGEVSFTEMFCPDWVNDNIFLSHMGEINIALCGEKPQIVEKDWPFTDAESPVCPSACFKEGEALLVNLAPGGAGKFSLIFSPVKMLKEENKKKAEGIRGWMKPDLPVNDFLKLYSEAGGTHHVALVYGKPVKAIRSFGSVMGWDVVEIK